MRSQFEFLGNALIGQYIPRYSWFHVRDPRARLLAFFCVMVGVVFSQNIAGLLLGFLIIITQYLVAHLPFKPVWKSFLRALPFILILAVLQVILTPETETSSVLFTIIGLDILQTGVMSALILLIRFAALIALLNAIVMSISTSQITAALFHLFKPLENLGFPVNDLTMVTQITLRYIPLVAQIAEKTAKAQAARGGDWERRGFNPIKQAKMVLPLIVPIIVMSLKRAETMATAMESRGFNAADERSSYYELAFNWQDAFLIGFSLFFCALMLLSGMIF